MTSREPIAREHLTLSGHLGADSFVPWILRYAAKLDLSLHLRHVDPERIEFDVEGAPELIDMMDVGCSLGPIDVWVEDVVRSPIQPAIPITDRICASS